MCSDQNRRHSNRKPWVGDDDVEITSMFVDYVEEFGGENILTPPGSRRVVGRRHLHCKFVIINTTNEGVDIMEGLGQ